MKKMNRSQSSYRQCKTLIAEEDNDLTKYASKQYPSRNPSANSLIENKENNSLFQSISERNFPTKREEVSEFEVGKEDVRQLQEKCRRYEDQLKRMYREREAHHHPQTSLQAKEAQYQSTTNLTGSKSYNYTDQFYSTEIEQLRGELAKRDRELQFYRQEQSSRTEEVESMSSELSCKIEKDQRDKNLLVKEINNKQIEINNLQEKVKYHKSEITTLKLYLDEKDSVIRELDDKLAQVDMKKKKIEAYEFQLKEFNELLKDLEANTHRLKQEAEQKEATITRKTADVAQLEQTIESYDDKLRAIEESLLRLSQERKALKERNEELERELADWRRSYDELLRRSEAAQDQEMKLRAYMSMVDELTRSKTDLFSSNEKYKIACTTMEKSLVKYQDQEREMNDLRRDLKERNERILELQDQERNKKHLEDYNSKLRREKDELFLKHQEKLKEAKAQALQLDELRSKNKLLQEELNEINENNLRVKERSEKLDTVMKANTQLNETIHKKVDEIQKLAYKINSLENVLKNLQNELAKQKIDIEASEQEIRELNIQNSDIRERYEAELSSKIAAEDKLVRSSQDISNLKAQLARAEDDAAALRATADQTHAQHEEEVADLAATITHLQQHNKQAELMLEDSNARMAELRREVEDCSRGLEEAFRKEREHQVSVSRCEQQMSDLKACNEKLTLDLRMARENVSKIIELGQLINRSTGVV